jgi:hypothetical protein
MTSPHSKPMRIYTAAKSARGPIADMFAGVKAGMMLENTSAGRARLIVTKEAPLVASRENRPFRAKKYPSRMTRYL